MTVSDLLEQPCDKSYNAIKLLTLKLLTACFKLGNGIVMKAILSKHYKHIIVLFVETPRKFITAKLLYVLSPCKHTKNLVQTCYKINPRESRLLGFLFWLANARPSYSLRVAMITRQFKKHIHQGKQTFWDEFFETLFQWMSHAAWRKFCTKHQFTRINNIFRFFTY
jgi:hypothetical protein